GANFLRQVCRVDVSLGSKNHSAFDDILELTNISGPSIVLQKRRRRGSEAGEFLVQLSIEMLQQFEREGQNVFPALPQRGDVQGNDIEPVIEVLAKFCFGD